MSMGLRRSLSLFPGLLVAAFVLCSTPSVSIAQQEQACDELETQMAMTKCAEQGFDEADAALNQQYKRTRAALSENDAESVKLLLTAQRAWIAYRDAHCETVGFQSRGGSIEPMLIAICKSELTKVRTEELLQLTEGD